MVTSGVTSVFTRAHSSFATASLVISTVSALRNAVEVAAAARDVALDAPREAHVRVRVDEDLDVELVPEPRVPERQDALEDDDARHAADDDVLARSARRERTKNARPPCC